VDVGGAELGCGGCRTGHVRRLRRDPWLADIRVGAMTRRRYINLGRPIVKRGFERKSENERIRKRIGCDGYLYRAIALAESPGGDTSVA